MSDDGADSPGDDSDATTPTDHEDTPMDTHPDPDRRRDDDPEPDFDEATPPAESEGERSDDAPGESDRGGRGAEGGEPAGDGTEAAGDGKRRARRGGRRRRRTGNGDRPDPSEMDDVARDLGRREVERLFTVLEAALTGPNQLDEESLDTLLTALEDAIVDPASVDSEELDRMLSLWEAVLVDATSGVDADRVLSIFDAAGVDAGRRRGARGLFQFLERLGLDDLLAGAGVDDVADIDGVAGAARTGGAGSEGDEPVDAYRLARLVATVTRNATLNSGQSGVRVGTELARAAATAESAADLLDESREIALSELERLGVDTGVDEAELARDRDRRTDDRTLLERGEALLEQSADLDYEEEYHPAYDHVVDQLAPDEARILRLLATEGPQPSVDVKDLGWLPFGSTLVATHLTMLGTKAGCRHEEREPAYLHNLHRLGLLWFAREPVDDLERYRVLEAQPNVEVAAEGAKREKMIRRSVCLTPFGAEFCRVALPVDVASGVTGVLGDVAPVE